MKIKHTYTEEEKEIIAQLVYDWLDFHNCSCGEDACQDDNCQIDAITLISDLADIKDVTDDVVDTKYNVGDEVWFIFDGKPINGKITKKGINISIRVEHKGHLYTFTRTAKGFDIYPTKEDLLKSL